MVLNYYENVHLCVCVRAQSYVSSKMCNLKLCWSLCQNKMHLKHHRQKKRAHNQNYLHNFFAATCPRLSSFPTRGREEKEWNVQGREGTGGVEEGAMREIRGAVNWKRRRGRHWPVTLASLRRSTHRFTLQLCTGPQVQLNVGRPSKDLDKLGK